MSIMVVRGRNDLVIVTQILMNNTHLEKNKNIQGIRLNENTIWCIYQPVEIHSLLMTKALTYWSFGYGPEYQHSQLPDYEVFRLFRFWISDGPAGNRTIHGTLQNFSLSPGSICPPYIALSSTWQPSQYQEGASPRLPIFIDGTEHLVTSDLHELLLVLRKHELPWTDLDYLWIDAICVARDNLERARQINLMDRIYWHAEDVILWLGSVRPHVTYQLRLTDGLTSNLRDLELFNSSPALKAVIAQWDERWDEPNVPVPGVYDIYTTYGFVKCAWRLVARIIQLPYWSGVWAVQELALARNPRFLLGDIVLDLWDLSRIANISSHLVKQKRASSPQYLSLGVRPNGYLMRLNLQIRNSLRKTLRGREDYQAFAVGTVEKPLSPAMILFFALDFTSEHVTKKEQDHINAVLGLVRGIYTAYGGTETPFFGADYNCTISYLFTRAAWYIIEFSSWLGILALAGAGSVCKPRLQGLPSWVPDFSSIPHVLRRVEKGFWRNTLPILLCLAESAPKKGLPFLQDNSLNLYGIRIGTIISLSEKISDLHSQNTIFEDAASLIAESYDPYQFTGQTLVEALWRTVVSDGRPSSADQKMGLSFLTFWLKTIIDHLLLNHVGTEIDLETFFKDRPKLHEYFFSCSPDHWVDYLTHLSDVIAFDPGWFTQHSLYKHLEAESEMFREWLNKHHCRMDGRGLLFRTEEGHLGNAYTEYVRRGDEVWVLARSPCVFVLRKKKMKEGDKEGGKKRMRLVGRAYVHGFVGGEKGLSLVERIKTGGGGRWENILIA